MMFGARPQLFDLWFPKTRPASLLVKTEVSDACDQRTSIQARKQKGTSMIPRTRRGVHGGGLFRRSMTPVVRSSQRQKGRWRITNPDGEGKAKKKKNLSIDHAPTASSFFFPQPSRIPSLGGNQGNIRSIFRDNEGYGGNDIATRRELCMRGLR